MSIVSSLLVGACSDDPPVGSPAAKSEELGRNGGGRPVIGVGEGGTYQRTVVFMDTTRDTSMFVSWDFENHGEPGGVRRSVRAWLGRGGEWALFMEDEWVTEPGGAPWRILPRGSARLVVGQEDVLQEIYYREGIRDLSVRLGEAVVEWSGQRGELYRILRGAAHLSGVETEGIVLDVSAVRAEGAEAPLEWAFLTDGGPLRLLVADPEGPGPYRAWARRGSTDLSWPEVTVTWEETRSFDRARRDVPVLWRFESWDAELAGEFWAESSHLQTQDSTGAILPVLGVYEIVGEVTVVGSGPRTSVWGFLRHYQR